MPSVRKLPPEEVTTIQNKGKGIRKLTEEEYDRILADFSVGDYGEVIPEVDENRLTVRNRLKAAAKRKGVGLEFARLRGELIRFKVTDGQTPPAIKPVRREKAHDETPPVVPSLNAAPPKRRGGRPKKTV